MTMGNFSITYQWVESQVDGPPFSCSRLLLVAQQPVFGATEVVTGDAVAKGPSAGSVFVILNQEPFVLSGFLAGAGDIAALVPGQVAPEVAADVDRRFIGDICTVNAISDGFGMTSEGSVSV